MRAVFGIDRIIAGSIEVDGRGIAIRGPRDALDAGIALVPEDRARAGLVREHSVGQNALMAAWKQFSRTGLVDDGAARRVASGFVERLDIRTTGIDQPVKDLSGGNQQKVVVAKNLSVQPQVLLLDDPTVGVDVGSKREILMQVRALAARRQRHPAGIIRARGAERGGRPGAGRAGRRDPAHPRPVRRR